MKNETKWNLHMNKCFACAFCLMYNNFTCVWTSAYLQPFIYVFVNVTRNYKWNSLIVNEWHGKIDWELIWHELGSLYSKVIIHGINGWKKDCFKRNFKKLHNIKQKWHAALSCACLFRAKSNQGQ